VLRPCSTLLGSTSVALLASACGAFAPSAPLLDSPAPPVASAARLASASPVASVTSSASIAPSARPDRFRDRPRVPAGSLGSFRADAELRELCGLAVHRDASGWTTIGCRALPPFDRVDELPDGTAVVVDDAYSVCAASAIYRGSFSRVGADEAVIGFELCSDDEHPFVNGAQPGFAVLIERTGGSVRYVSTLFDVSADECVVATPRGAPSILVCPGGMSAPPDGGATWLHALDFASPGGPSRRTIATITRNAPTHPCGIGMPVIDDGITLARVGTITVRDGDGDGEPEVEVPIDRSHAPPSARLVERVEAACSPGATIDFARILPRLARHALRFETRARRFEADAATKTLLDAWAKESSLFWLRAGGVPDHGAGPESAP
jgi:hypothetical protein